MKFAAIFDLEGVLIDSMDIVWKSFNELMKPYNIQFTEKDVRMNLGRSLRDQLRIWNERYGIDLDFAEFAEKAGEIQHRLYRESSKAEPGLIKLLEELERNKIKMGIGTNRTRSSAVEILKILKISSYFNCLVTAYDVTGHKPEPDVYLAVASKLHVLPRSCLVFEDSADGVQAAKAAGMKCVGKLHKYNDRKQLREADKIIKNFSELNYDKLLKLVSQKAQKPF